ncbi:PREDICTED: uncharacterized protein LOC105154785 [Acromyrmex echinatior]|uniref:uncharacterized protein LOC105154785 n=1 Tax=Acromyrmex echinatior TaxID=103372 RepID=UPI000580E8E4|nr:PREDICTED: uncharacterized protein LOC105154785 [Acromyrmex echinatior]
MAPPTNEELQEQVMQLQVMLRQMQGNVVSNVAHVDSYKVPKIPPFLIKNPVIWFIQIEATFEATRITEQKTKAHHVIMSLDAEAIACCRDLIAEPDVNEPYTKLKQRQVLTSGKPSQILSRLRNLNSDKRCDDAVIKIVFFEHLSPHIRSILATTESTDLDKLAKMADKIVETVGDSAQCAAASSSEFKPSDLEARIDGLAADIATLAAEVKRYSRSQTREGK